MQGKLKVDEFITHRKNLPEINVAFEDMKQGDCIRCVVDMRKAQLDRVNLQITLGKSKTKLRLRI